MVLIYKLVESFSKKNELTIIMKLKSSIYFLSLFILLIPVYTPGFIDKQDNIRVDIDQKSSIELFEGALSYLESKSSNFSNFITYSDEFNSSTLVYYGKVGLAGTGLNLLEARKNDASWVGTDVNDRLLSLATDIADFLISIASVDNATHSIISLNNENDLVDLSLEFGLLGITEFFIELYNQTQTALYADFATKLMQSVNDLAITNSTDMYFRYDSYITMNNSWTPYNDFDYYFSNLYPEHEFTFSGMSFGTAGIISTAIKFLDIVDANSNLVGTMMNKSIHYLWRSSRINGSELSFYTAEEYTGMESTSIATGVAGIGNTYLELYSLTANNTYLDNAVGIMHWLNGTTSGERRTGTSWIINDTVDDDLEFGLEFGLAGIIDFLDNLYDYTKDINQTVLIKEATISLRNYGTLDSDLLSFPERYIDGSFILKGSTSYSYGSGGILELFNKIGIKYNNSFYNEYAAQIKNYLKQTYQMIDGYTAIYTRETFNFETNPKIGISGTLLYLSSFTQGLLDFDYSKIVFPETELGYSSVKTLVLNNTGEATLRIFNITVGEYFTVDNTELNIAGNASAELNITFTPLKEGIIGTSINFTNGLMQYSIIIETSGYDNPQLVSFTGPSNNTEFNEYKKLDFVLEVSDQSAISSVVMRLMNENETDILSSAMIFEDNVYKGSWDPANYANGTYILDFEITDALNHKTIVRYVYSIGIYTPALEERIFSDTVLYGIIIATVVLLIIAIILTKRIKS